jgi:hypothetical protein
MEIISHRGYWRNVGEKNQEIAFRRSFELGFGTETDIRDASGKLVIAHDPPKGSEITVERFLQIYLEYDRSLPLALNIKADGLQTRLKVLLEKYLIANYFVFDMSIPDAIGYQQQGLKAFTRHSDIETVPYLYKSVIGVWIDGFESDWVDETAIITHLDAGKQVCIVSSELHKRDYRPFWERLAKMSIINHPYLMICTDYPEEAKKFFAWIPL